MVRVRASGRGHPPSALDQVVAGNGLAVFHVEHDDDPEGGQRIPFRQVFELGVQADFHGILEVGGGKEVFDEFCLAHFLST
ncbi:hypothetical protein G039_0317580 [Pseudomonas aeruginosa VRFPA01]|nr:hypothetical protein G039_0317580 [Pseudomonas aeruginosa VRFPA01]